MNKELKTLKDLNIEICDGIMGCMDKADKFNLEFDDCFVEIKELKAEAVKWVKDLDNDIFQRKGSKMLNKNEISCLISTSEWIKYFFNLTEELK